MSFNEDQAKTLVQNIFDDMKVHKDYSQELHEVMNVVKSTIAREEKYADRGEDGQGKRVVKTVRFEAKDVTGELMSNERKQSLYNGCLAKYNTLKTQKP